MRWRAAMIPAAPETKKEYAIYLNKKNVEKRRESGKSQKKRRESGKPQNTPKHVAQLYLTSNTHCLQIEMQVLLVRVH